MEHLNQVELKGVIGSVKIDEVAGTRVARFSMATNYTHLDCTGCAIIETTWHTVTAWQGAVALSLDLLEKGSKVHVFGRLRQHQYISDTGERRSTVDILAHSLRMITEEKD